MGLSQGSIETVDAIGSTTHFNGSVNTSAIAIPTVAGNVIAEVLVENAFTNSSTKNLLVSFDGGTTFKTLASGSSLVWSPKGDIRQIYIKGSVGGVDYEILMNRESA